MTIDEALKIGLSTLSGKTDAPDLDVQRILLHVMGQRETAWLHSHSETILPIEAEENFTKDLQERAAGKPLTYILGWTEFYGRQFLVTPDVLIPRPETEELVTQALAVIQNMFTEKGRKLIVADIGTGSGCVGITLALQSPVISQLVATDISEAALFVARRNAAEYNLQEKIEFLQGDMLAPLQDRQIDLIVSNPPYVPTAELAQSPTMETKGLQFEPRMALDGGEDGLKYIKQIEASGIPAVLETLGGEIMLANF